MKHYPMVSFKSDRNRKLMKVIDTLIGALMCFALGCSIGFVLIMGVTA